MTLTKPLPQPQPTPAAHARRGRPRLLIACWLVLLGGLAVVAPAVQDALGVPWEWIALIMFAPTVAALVLALVARGWFPSAWSSVGWPSVVRPAALALLFVIVNLAVATVLTGRLPELSSSVAGAPLALFLVLQAAGALGEEIGWRGVMQRAGEEIVPKWVATIALGILFGATHLGHWAAGPAFMVGFTASAVLMCVAIAVVWEGGFWQRMVPATMIHLGVNLSWAALGLGTVDLNPWLLPLPAAAALLVVTMAAALNRRFDRGPATT